MAHVLVETTLGAANSAPIYGVLGVGLPWLVLGAVALLEPSLKIPSPRSRSQGQVFASGDPTGLPLGLAHFGFTSRLLAPAAHRKTGPRTSF
jgi:hypothetical protein